MHMQNHNMHFASTQIKVHGNAKRKREWGIKMKRQTHLHTFKRGALQRWRKMMCRDEATRLTQLCQNIFTWAGHSTCPAQPGQSPRPSVSATPRWGQVHLQRPPGPHSASTSIWKHSGHTEKCFLCTKKKKKVLPFASKLNEHLNS